MKARLEKAVYQQFLTKKLKKFSPTLKVSPQVLKLPSVLWVFEY
jgi:hypothetical protein